MTDAVAWSTVLPWACSAAALLGVAVWVWPRAAPLRGLAIAAGLTALAATAVAWGLRTAEAGHLPLFGTFEGGLSLTLAVLLGAGIVWLRRPRRLGVWPAAAAVAAALMAHALRYDTSVYALTISERSWVVDVHAVLAWAAFAVFAAQLGFALRRLLPGSGGDTVDAALSFTLALGFVLHTAMLASGSLYEFLLFGSVWSFDPIETLGFVAWMAYATLLHMQRLAGWQGRRLARWSVALFVVLLVSYRGIVHFPAWSTYHIFDIDLRVHLTGEEGAAGGGVP